MTESQSTTSGDPARLTVSRGSHAAVARAVGALLAFLTQITLARVLGIAEFGLYAYTLAVINLGVIGAKGGLDTTILRFVGIYVAKGDIARYRGLQRFSSLVAIAAGLLVAFLALLFLKQSGAWSISDLNFVQPVMLLVVPLLGLAALRSSSLLALGHVMLAYMPELLFRPIIIMTGVLALTFLLADVLAQHALLMLGIAAVTSIAVSSFWLYQRAPTSGAAQAVPAYEVSVWSGTSGTFLISSVAYFALTQADILIVGTFLGNEAVGGYTAAARTAIYVQFLLLAVQRAVAPLVSQHYERDDVAGTQRILDVIATVAGASGALIGIVVIVFAEQVMWLFGAEFQGAAVLLQILAVGQIVNCLTGATNISMNMTGHHRQALYFQLAFSLVGIVAATIVAQRSGVVAVAIVTALVIACWNIASSWYLWKVAGLKCWIRSTSMTTTYRAIREKTLE